MHIPMALCKGTTLGVLRWTARLVDPPRPIMKRSLDGPAISILRCDRTQAFGHPRRHIQELVPGNSLEQTFSLAPSELRLKRTGQRIIVNQHVDPCRGGHSALHTHAASGNVENLPKVAAQQLLRQTTVTPAAGIGPTRVVRHSSLGIKSHRNGIESLQGTP